MTYENWWNNNVDERGDGPQIPWTWKTIKEFGRRIYGDGYNTGYEDGGDHAREVQDQIDFHKEIDTQI